MEQSRISAPTDCVEELSFRRCSILGSPTDAPRFFENGLFDVPIADLVIQALYQGLLTATISLALYGRAIRLLGASNAAAFVALGPIMAALIAIPMLGEWPSNRAWAAILIIASGVYLASGGPIPVWRLRPSAGTP